MMYKECSKCKEVKAITEFYKDNRLNTGYRSNCKQCSKQYIKQYREINREQLQEYQRDRRKASKERIREYGKQYREANKDKRRQYAQYYYETNRERRREYHKQRYRIDRERILTHHKQYLQTENGRELSRHKNRKYQALKRGAEGSHTLQEWLELKAKYNHTCPMCKRKEPNIKLTEDHIIPISRGGSNCISNIQPLCRSCNASKRIKAIKFSSKTLGQMEIII